MDVNMERQQVLERTQKEFEHSRIYNDQNQTMMSEQFSFLKEQPREYVVVQRRSSPKRLHSATRGGSRSRGRDSKGRLGSNSAVKRAYIRRKASRDRSVLSNCTFANLNDSRNWEGEYESMDESI